MSSSYCRYLEYITESLSSRRAVEGSLDDSCSRRRPTEPQRERERETEGENVSKSIRLIIVPVVNNNM